MKLFDADAYILVDNIMVAMFVGFGICSAIPLLWFVIRISPIKSLGARLLDHRQKSLALALSTIGLTAFLFEDPVMAMSIGALTSILTKQRTKLLRQTSIEEIPLPNVQTVH